MHLVYLEPDKLMPRFTVKIGEHITLSQLSPGKVWLSWDGGEGMECSEAQLAEWLERFYGENF